MTKYYAIIIFEDNETIKTGQYSELAYVKKVVDEYKDFIDKKLEKVTYYKVTTEEIHE